MQSSWQVPQLRFENDHAPGPDLGPGAGPPDLAPSPRTPTRSHDAGITYHDKYVVDFDFSKLDSQEAVQKLKELLDDLDFVGLHTEVRAGHEQSLLVFVKAPRELLGNAVYKSRVKDWLYGITTERPAVGGRNTIVDGAFEAEDLLSMYHLISWRKDLGGAGITPGLGRWECVRSIFPLHNVKVNQELLGHLSRRVFLRNEDLDQIRNLFGAKVAMYFAFLQTYLVFLFFPAVAGLLAWLYLPKYSLSYGLLIGLWCIVFVEYWKLQEVDLGIRWDVKGVGGIKVNRPTFKHDGATIDETGTQQYHSSAWKQAVRQALQVPFVLGAVAILGAIIVVVFALEVLISDTYEGPYKYYLEYLPTVLLAVCLPYLSSFLEDISSAITELENHRTHDTHEMSKTQKNFVLHAIINYLPIFLTAFLYVPFGEAIVPRLKTLIRRFVPAERVMSQARFHSDPDRLRNEVIALTVTGQIASAGEELVLPYVLHKLRSWYRDWRSARLKRARTLDFAEAMSDDPAEARFLRQAREQASLELYDVQQDYLEMVLQFGHLALFSPVWPLVPIGFLVNNWFELRSDFIKICHGSQRPAPTRADSIGAWVDSLGFLAWMGSISSAAIVHLFGTGGGVPGLGGAGWLGLPVTVFVSEHIYLLVRGLVRSVLQRVGSQQTRRQRTELYVMRKRFLNELEESNRGAKGLEIHERERRKSVLVTGRDSFWTKQIADDASLQAGVAIIQALKVESGAPAKGHHHLVKSD